MNGLRVGLLTVLLVSCFSINVAADPATSLSYCSYLGGSGNEYGAAIAVDRSSHRYVVTGRTTSNDFPVTPGAYDSWHNSLPYFPDVFVSVFNIADHSLAYSTFFGGNYRDISQALTLDDQGNIYIGGRTDSSNLPTTPDAYDPNYTYGYGAGFVASLTADLDSLRWSTYIGGDDFDEVSALLYDPEGYLYVGGVIYSDGFPFDTSFVPGGGAFVAKFRAEDGSMVWSSAVGIGNVNSMQLSNDGRLIVAGLGSEIMTSEGAYDTTPDGPSDLFFMSLDKETGAFDWGTYAGGSWRETFIEILIGPDGNILFAACVDSDDFPLSATGWGTALGGEGDVVVGALSADGSDLLWARNIGGSAFDGGATVVSNPALALDDDGNLLVLTSTQSEDVATTSASLYPDFLGEYDALLASISTDGATCRWLTYLGGSYGDEGKGLVLIPSGMIVLGYTVNGDVNPALPVTIDAFDGLGGGTADAFVMQLEDPTLVGLVVEDVTLVQNGEEIVVDWRVNEFAEPSTFQASVAVNGRVSSLPVSSRHGAGYQAIDHAVCTDDEAERTYRISHINEFDQESVIIERTITPDCAACLSWSLSVMSGNNDEFLFALRLGQPSMVRLSVYDVKGRRIAVLPGETLSTGEHFLAWDGTDNRGRTLPSGRYLARCVLDDRDLSTSFTLLR